MPINNEILQRLKKNDPTLKSLNLREKMLTHADIVPLAKALAKNATLTTLDLGRNQIGAAGAKALSEMLAKNLTLTELNLSWNRVGDAGAKALSEALTKNTALTFLGLYGNKVGVVGAKALSEALVKNTTLTFLGLYVNEVGAAGAKALSEALAKNATLTTLSLHDNQVDAAGAEALSEALAKNVTLTTLDLGYNKVGAAGVRALSEGLGKNTTLTTLDLRHNKVGDAGAKALSEALAKNSTLTELNLINNQVGSAGMNALSEELAKNSTLTTLDLSDNKVGDAGQASLQAIKQKLAQNKALTEKKKESKFSAVLSPEVIARPKENKNTPVQPMPSSGSRDVKDAIVSSSFSSEVKANQVSPSLPSLAPTSPVDNKTTSVLDAKTVDKLLKLAQQQEAQLLQPIVPGVSQESMDALQKKLSSIEATMQHLDGEALTVLQGKAQEVRILIDQATAQRQAEVERNHIESDDCLCDYYYVLRSQLLHMWLACKVIHSEMVDNDKKTKLDYLADNIDKIAGRFPGLSLLTGFIKAAASGWSYREKKEAMQHMAGFCLGLVEGDTMIDTLARQLTLSQPVTLKARLTSAKTSTFRKALATFKKAKNWALVNDIDNATKEFAAKQASQILEAVMKGKIKTPCRSKDIPQLFSLVMGVNAVYKSPIALPSTTNSFNPNATIINTVNANSPGMQPTQSYSIMQTTLNVAPNATTKDEVAELKRVLEKQQQEQQRQEEKMKAMQEELSRVKNQNQPQEPTAQKRDLDSLQAEFNHLKAESQKNGSQVQKQDFDNLQRQLKKLQEGLEQAGITRGGNQLQMSSTAFGAGTATSEQRQIAELQQQVRLLTARVLTTQEPQSPEDEAEDPARLKLIL